MNLLGAPAPESGIRMSSAIRDCVKRWRRRRFTEINQMNEKRAMAPIIQTEAIIEFLPASGGHYTLKDGVLYGHKGPRYYMEWKKVSK